MRRFAIGWLLVYVGLANAKTLNLPNHPPLPGSDLVETSENKAVLIDVTANDVDPDKNKLHIKLFEKPYNGEIQIVEKEGRQYIQYTPTLAYVGHDMFHYLVEDEQGAQAKGEVAITIAVKPPTTTDDSAKILVDGSTEIDVLANDVAYDQRKLTIGYVEAGNLGSAEVITKKDGRQILRYSPLPRSVGTDVVKYWVSDNHGGFVMGRLHIEIYNTAPIATDDSSATLLNTPIDILVLGNDTDPDGQGVALESVEQPEHGRVAWDFSSKRAIYFPNENFQGQDQFYYKVTDGHGGSARAKVTVDVNYLPPLATADSFRVTPGVPVTFKVLDNDYSPHGFPLVVQSYSQPSDGRIILNSNGSFTYLPKLGRSPIQKFSYTVTDGIGTATVSVTLNLNDFFLAAARSRNSSNSN